MRHPTHHPTHTPDSTLLDAMAANKEEGTPRTRQINNTPFSPSAPILSDGPQGCAVSITTVSANAMRRRKVSSANRKLSGSARSRCTSASTMPLTSTTRLNQGVDGRWDELSPDRPGPQHTCVHACASHHGRSREIVVEPHGIVLRGADIPMKPTDHIHTWTCIAARAPMPWHAHGRTSPMPLLGLVQCEGREHSQGCLQLR